MKARLIQKERIHLSDDRFVEIVLWFLPEPIPPSRHGYKYRMVYVVNGVCVIRYDNERGKGDHKHIGDEEIEYTFITINRLLDDFWVNVENYGG